MAQRSRRKKADKKAKAIISAVAVILIILASFIADKAGVIDTSDPIGESTTAGSVSNETSDTGNILEAYFIDVGQGDSSLFISDGVSMLIDSGEAENADTVISTVSDCGVTALDYVVVTHAHSDHMGAMADVITSVPVKNIIVSEPCDDNSQTATYEKFIDAAENSGANIILAEPDYTFSVGKAECTVLAPFNVDSSNENNNSIVMLINAGETSFLMTGDAEKSVEKEIMEKYPNLDIDILKVGHHGSSTSSYKQFVEQISPELGIIQCGLNNSYGHPTEKTLETLDSLGIKYYRTDICGAVTVRCTAETYTVEVEK